MKEPCPNRSISLDRKPGSTESEEWAKLSKKGEAKYQIILHVFLNYFQIL